MENKNGAVTEVAFIQVFFFTAGSKQKNKNENTECHYDFFITFKSEPYGKQGNPLLLFKVSNEV